MSALHTYLNISHKSSKEYKLEKRNTENLKEECMDGERIMYKDCID